MGETEYIPVKSPKVEEIPPNWRNSLRGKAAEKALRINKGETAFSRQKFYRLSQSKLSYLSVFVEQLTCLFIFRITFQ